MGEEHLEVRGEGLHGHVEGRLGAPVRVHPLHVPPWESGWRGKRGRRGRRGGRGKRKEMKELVLLESEAKVEATVEMWTTAALSTPMPYPGRPG